MGVPLVQNSETGGKARQQHPLSQAWLWGVGMFIYTYARVKNETESTQRPFPGTGNEGPLRKARRPFWFSADAG